MGGKATDSNGMSKEISDNNDKPSLRRGSDSSSSDDIGPVTVETYDQFTEPIEVLSYEHKGHGSEPPLSKQVTGHSVNRTQTSDPDFEIDFEDGDPDNPKNWPLWRVASCITAVSYMTLCVVLYSTSYTSAIPGIIEYFDIESETVAVLGVTVYLVGLAIGSIILAPLSEMYGRRPVYLITVAIFVILIVPAALAKNIEAIFLSRFFGALFGSAMISNSPGSVNDMVNGKS
jgi:uncharacterized membrane protein YiaA